MIYSPANDHGVKGYSSELYKFYDELHTVKVKEIGRWRWLDTSLESKEWVLEWSLVFLHQKALVL